MREAVREYGVREYGSTGVRDHASTELTHIYSQPPPTPLARYKQAMDAGGRVEQLQHQLRYAANDLSCTTRLVLLLIQLRPDIGLSDEDAAVLANYLSPSVVDSEAQGWEELTDAALTHLLKTSLAKTAKGEGAVVHQPLVMPKDTSRLKKHIQIVVDRFRKGATLVGPRPEKGGGGGGGAGAGGGGGGGKAEGKDGEGREEGKGAEGKEGEGKGA